MSKVTTQLAIECGCGHPAWQHPLADGGRCGSPVDPERCICGVPRAEVIAMALPEPGNDS